jgi:acetyl esterase/lipase
MVLGITALKDALRSRLKNRQNISFSLRRQQVDTIAAFGAPDMHQNFNWLDLGSVPAVKFKPDDATGPGCILYIHGGAFVAGSPVSHAYLGAALAKTTKMPVYALAYRLAPEYPYPAAVYDVIQAVKFLADMQGGYDQISLVGDSAGATLMLLAAQKLRDDGIALHRLVAISPLVDLCCEGETYVTLAAADPFINQEGLKRDVQEYLAGADPSDPSVSPILSNLAGLPPILIQVGADEVLLGDAQALEKAVHQAGGKATMQIWPEMIHVWHLFPHFVIEADAAIAEIAAFLKPR